MMRVVLGMVVATMVLHVMMRRMVTMVGIW